MQDGLIYKKSGSWLLQYRRDEIVNGKVVRKRVAKKLAPVCDEYRSKASVKHLAQDILAPINARRARPESAQTPCVILRYPVASLRAIPRHIRWTRLTPCSPL